MKFYLSSFLLGNRSDDLVRLMPDNKKIAYIPNAGDYMNTDSEKRMNWEQLDMERLEKLGLIEGYLDLKEYFGKQNKLREILNKFEGVSIGGRGIKYLKKILPSLSELRTAFRTANDFIQFSNMKISANVCIPHCIINQKECPNIPISSCGSNIDKRPITFDSFGNVRMCNHSPNIIGNIHTESMNSILTSEYAKSWQTTIPAFCKNCDQLTKCMGGCRAASEQLGKSLKNEDPIIEFMNKSMDF